MKLQLCPTCSQIIPPRIGVLFFHSLVKKRIYDFIAKHPEGVMMAELMDHVYALEPSGGPDSPGSLRAHICQMRPMLAKVGMAIENSRGMGSGYRLVPL